MTGATALIADDEPLLIESLLRRLAEAWPALQVLATAEDGISATEMALTHVPDVLFLDVRMPGRTGLDAAACIAEDWPGDRLPPLLVFITAHDEFALPAFEREAMDYVLKPVTSERMHKLTARLQQRLRERQTPAHGDEMEQLFRRIQALSGQPSEGLIKTKVLRASVGNSVHLIPVTDILFLESADKYVNVVTAAVEALVRISMRDLLASIDTTEMTQIHRGTVVNSRHVVRADRDEAGNIHLVLRGRDRRLKVSRAFAHKFRPM